jgi:CubicO group peptidase (beta-lactamase class C family)
MSVNSSEIEQIIDDQGKKPSFSGVVLVQERGEFVFSKGYGFANRAESIPNTLETRFQMASGCKIFTSVAICQLVQRGMISFDTPLKDCLNISFPSFSPDITVHHLLTHSSGITSYFEEDVDPDYEALWRELPMYCARTPSDFLPLFQHKGMKFTPGEKFEYNDGGFIILGLIIEQQAKMSFSEYVEKNIFAPCAMTDSGYFATDRLPARTAHSYIYNKDDDSYRTNFFAVPIVGGPDGGAYTTAPDMARFWRSLFDHRVLNKRFTEKLLYPHIAAESEGRNKSYGYGVWMIKRNDSVVTYYVEGWDPGVAFVSAFSPENETLITIIANTNKPVWPIYDRIIELWKREDRS